MAEKTLTTTILLRNDTAANWTSKNPTLKKGEVGIELDTRKFKFGDGISKWSELSYAGADDTALTALTSRVAVAESDIAALQTDLSAVETTVSEHTTSIEDHGTRLTAVESKAAANESAIAQANTDIEALNASMANVYTKTQTDTKIAEEIGKQAHLSAQLVESVDEMTDTAVLYLVKDASVIGKDQYVEYMLINGTPTVIGDTSTDLTNYATTAALSAVQTTVESHDTDIQALQAADTTLSTRIKTLEDVGAQKNLINSVDTSEFAVDETGNLTINEVAQSKVVGLTAALETKVDKIEGYTLLSPTDKTKLDALVIGESGVEISGKVNAANVEGLGDWITDNRDSTAGLFDTASASKLGGIEAGAQVNVLEGIQIAGNDITAVGKKVNIPIAADQLGVVMSSTAAGKVKVEADGSMTVNSIDIENITQSESTTLVLDGGNA